MVAIFPTTASRIDKLIDILDVLPITADRKKSLTHQTENLPCVDLHPNSTCFVFQVQYQLAKLREQATVISNVEVFEERYHRPLKSSMSSWQGSMAIIDNEIDQH